MSLNIDELITRKEECYKSMKLMDKNDVKYLEIYREYHRLKNKITYHTNDTINSKKKEYAIQYLQNKYKTPEYNAYKRSLYKLNKAKKDTTVNIPIC